MNAMIVGLQRISDAEEHCLALHTPDRTVVAPFWHRAAQHELICADRVAVSGGVVTAVSMFNELFRHRVSIITLISPQPFTPGGGLFENTLFSGPTGWASLTPTERRDASASHRSRSCPGCPA